MKKNQIPPLKILCLSQPFLHTEWLSIQGHKYNDALPFSVQFVEKLEDADIVAWDGIFSPKNVRLMEDVMNHLRKGATLILMGEARTLLKKSPLVEIVDLDNIAYEELSGWSVLPEEILGCLQKCHQKIKHV